MIRTVVTRAATALASTLAFLLLLADSAVACGVSYDSATPSPAGSCGAAAAVGGAATIATGVAITALVMAVRGVTSGVMTPSELATYVDALKQPQSEGPALGEALQEAAARVVERSGQGRVEEASKAAEQVVTLMAAPRHEAQQVVNDARQAISATQKYYTRANAALARAGTQAHVAVVLDSARQDLAAAESKLNEGQQSFRQAETEHQSLLRAALEVAGNPTDFQSTAQSAADTLNDAVQKATQAITLASSAHDRLTLVHIALRAVQAAEQVKRGNWIAAFRAARDAAARAHEVAFRVNQAAQNHQAAGTPSTDLEQAAEELVRHANAMTLRSHRVLHSALGKLAAPEMKLAANEFTRIADQVSHLLPSPTGRRQSFSLARSRRVALRTHEMSFEALHAAGRVQRAASGAMEARRFLDARGLAGQATPSGSALSTARAKALISPGPPERPEATRTRVRTVPGRLPMGHRFAFQNSVKEPNTDYVVTHEHQNGATYQATYRTDGLGNIVEIWTLSGHRIQQSATRGKSQPNPELQEPRPNCIYHVNDRFTYITDEAGRTVLATGALERHGASRHKVAKNAETDERKGEFLKVKFVGGHIFAKIFGGPGEKINIVAMLDGLNHARVERTAFENWGRFEYELDRRMKRGGEKISMTVELPYYDTLGNSRVSRTPSGMLVTYLVEGVRQPPRAFVNLPEDGFGRVRPHDWRVIRVEPFRH
ncbi:DNA/RNA non-specific endonuclease [Streptomyces sp. NPDC047130]|uniref:DNA/RNA non-specific endonuclease n=1 Tax=Streptomyces sp. NPDC047130 TaxID=3155261 RepID=UPI0033C25A7E